jgi:transcriptional regulator with XRE-family HTH domain
MRQQDLAAVLGVSRTTVDAWENDRAYPRSSIGAIEVVLGISLADDEPPRPIPPELRQAVRRHVQPEDQERVLDALEGAAFSEPGEDEGDGESLPGG